MSKKLRWAGFIGLSSAAGGYGVLLVAYTLAVYIPYSHRGALGELILFAIMLALVWAVICLCLAAVAARPYDVRCSTLRQGSKPKAGTVKQGPVRSMRARSAKPRRHNTTGVP